MSPNQRIERLFSLLKWFVFIFILLGISNKYEQSLVVSVGCKLSPAFAQTIAVEANSAKVQQEKDPEAMRQIGQQMRNVKYTVRGITSFTLAFFIVYFRWNNRKLTPDTSLAEQ